MHQNIYLHQLCMNSYEHMNTFMAPDQACMEHFFKAGALNSVGGTVCCFLCSHSFNYCS